MRLSDRLSNKVCVLLTFVAIFRMVGMVVTGGIEITQNLGVTKFKSVE